MTAKRLTPKQRLFVIAYLETLNGTEAARRAGYKGNDNVLGVVAYDNLRIPKINEAIEAAFKARAMSADETLLRLTDIARGDLGEFIGLTIDELKAHPRRRLLKEVERTVRTIPVEDGEPIEVETVKLKLYGADAALGQLGRYHKLFVDRVQTEDDETRAIDDIRAGRIQYAALAEAFDEAYATRLFAKAGVPLPAGQGARGQ